MPVEPIEGLILSSTTDTQEQVDEAAGIKPKEVEASDADEPAAVETVPDADAGKSESQEVKKPTGKGVSPKVSLAEYNKIARQKMEAKWENEKLAKELAELKAAKESAPAQPEKNREIDEDAEPDQAKYTDTNTFLRDHYLWMRRKEDEQARIEQLESAYQERVQKTKATHDDWDAVKSENDDITVPKVIHDAIKRLKNGPEVAYYLTKNQDVLNEILQLDMLEAITELGALNVSLSAPKASDSPKPIRTNAPRPITPVGGSTKSTVSIDDPNISQEQYYETRKAMRRGR